MKTAMQELIGLIPDAKEINEYISNNQPDEKMLDEWLWERMFKGRNWIEKEKEQIINAWKNNRDLVYFDENKDELSENTASELGEEYYTLTYTEDDDWGGLSNEELIGDDEIPNL
jgi:hypothetical protein